MRLAAARILYIVSASEMTYYIVSGGALNSTHSLIHSLTLYIYIVS